MNIEEIVKDSVSYPLSDWKKILMLGIIIVISGIAGVAVSLNTTNIYLISLLVVIGFLVGFLVNGYMFRIIKSSLDGKSGLPEFNNWIDMCINGLKVFIAFIIYLMPVILIISLFVPVFFHSTLTLESMGLTPLDLLINSLNSVTIPGIFSFIGILDYLSLVTPEGMLAFIIGMLYLFIITPMLLVAIANMAYYEGEFRSAFRFSEILDEIRIIGRFNLIKWYLTTGILFLILFTIISTCIVYIFNLADLSVIGGVLISLIITPYFYMYFARSVALYYMPDEE
ncbi:DUF4013 domain-containing protein [Methanobacterium sp.]|uniref:DUF4013 domain-containing protein n=1 Tax=Methanobacterium sp. TaxID=2164 RepID=UPI003C709506